MVNETSAISNIPNVDVAKKQWAAYQELCRGLLDKSDYQKIIVKEKDENGQYISVEREFKKKSAWQKLSRAFNVDTEIIEKEFIRTKTGRINEAYYCIKASLPNGRSVESDALCSRSEKGKSKVSDHTIMATAKTRATNRAISELIGAGEVSSDEMTAECKAIDDPDHYYITHSHKQEGPKNKESVITKVEPKVVPTPQEHDLPKDEFQTAAEVGEPNPEDDPLKSQCYMIMDMLEAEGKAITKHSMKLKVVAIAKEKGLPTENKRALLDYIAKHCPEELSQ